MKTLEEHKEEARHILNHYSGNSEKDIICLGKRLQQAELTAFKSAGLEAVQICEKRQGNYPHGSKTYYNEIIECGKLRTEIFTYFLNLTELP